MQQITPMMTKCALLLVTSDTSLDNPGRSTGFYYDEMAAPYWTSRDLGWDVNLTSVAGGAGLPGPKTLVDPDNRPPAVARFIDDTLAMDAHQTTAKAAEIQGSYYDYVFLPGGHGAMWDFDTNLIGDIFTDACALGAVVGAVCHGPSGVLQARGMNGDPLVHTKGVNSFTSGETEQIGLIGVESFLLGTRSRDAGALFECGDNCLCHVVKVGRLITGQNPQSTGAVCRLLKESLEESRCSHLYTH
ncbi:type 1 glutamine amidotransferase domain-containing protein [Litorivicinus sp.]|nr:type 1 glutamine amidotransferase domain-containing protein [Litorivicinus sp.]